MTLQPPFVITSRLLPGVRVADATISIETIAEEWEGSRPYVVYLNTPEFHHEDYNDRSSALGGDYRSALCTWLSFLLAAVESYPDGENADLFPVHVVEWACEHSSEIEALWLDLEEQP